MSTDVNVRATKGQVAMVIDLNKCMGCQSCSVACKMAWTQEQGEDYQWWCTTNTLPGQGTPKNWEAMGGGYLGDKLILGKEPTADDFGGGWRFNKDDVFFGGKAQTTHLEPTDRQGKSPTWGPNWDEDQGAGEFPNSYFFYMPRMCNHCTRPACVEACPSGAMYKRSSDGVVLRDEDMCKGSRDCMKACPYKKIYFNHERGVAQHCHMCFPRLEQGIAPVCARNCPGRLIFTGILSDADDAVHRLVYEWEVALPLHPEYGTEPNIFYIPPLSPFLLREDKSIDTANMRIPLDYLKELFGPKVEAALDVLQSEMKKVRDGGQSELMDTLIVYQWKSLFGPFIKEPATVDALEEGEI